MLVLIVDDEEPIRELLREVLSSNHLCLSVATAEEALALLTRHKFDVMLTDVGLPGMGGLNLVRRVYQAYPDMCVIVMSGATLDSTSGWSELDIFAYLLKPFEIVEVELCVAKAAAHCFDRRR